MASAVDTFATCGFSVRMLKYAQCGPRLTDIHVFIVLPEETTLIFILCCLANWIARLMWRTVVAYTTIPGVFARAWLYVRDFPGQPWSPVKLQYYKYE